ncbi:hypothetical protein IFM89_029459 [Coptis chinensis]|uniref:Ferredoxin-thioredoxin reductase catalytic chain, chloroplastic n=1 Tax=Coptis chinensis TaxID=261450 RepID=A0A835HTV2_9MAGN|nr:hypothetical protein IFM89_029459 [Coptis chinensis]
MNCLHHYSVGIPATKVSSTTSTRFQRHVIQARVEPSDKSVEIMRKFSEQYARRSGTYFCVDKGVTSVVIKGLADHKDSLGAPLCPCRLKFSCISFVIAMFQGLSLEKSNLQISGRDLFSYVMLLFVQSTYSHRFRHYDDKAAEAGQGFWNCPCVPMRERKECHCMLFLTPDNDFAGREQEITLDEIRESTENM